MASLPSCFFVILHARPPKQNMTAPIIGEKIVLPNATIELRYQPRAEGRSKTDYAVRICRQQQISGICDGSRGYCSIY